MWKRVLTLAMAFVGLSVGAGFASGQEVLQFFVHFDQAGLWGAVAVALAMGLGGLIIVQLGSYYQAQEHTEVLDEVAHPVLAKFFDLAVTLTVFCIGFVMFAGAGANLHQEFGLPSWVGSVLLLVILLTMVRFDINKISRIIGAATPFIILLIVIAAGYAFVTMDYSAAERSAATTDIFSTLPNIWVASVNYFGFSMIVVVSMGIVIGGDYLNPRVAGMGGLFGGLAFGLMLILTTAALYWALPAVVGSDLPMLELVGMIHPMLGRVMSLVIYAMIFNSAVGMFFALSRRLSTNKPENFQRTFVVSVLLGFVVSFVGFTTLVAYVFPALGYIGVGLGLLLLVSWIKDRSAIVVESKRRRRIRDLMVVKFDPKRPFSARHQREINRALAASNIETEQLRMTARAKAKEQMDEVDHVELPKAEHER